MMGHSESHLLHPLFMQLLSQYFEIFEFIVQLRSCLFFVGSRKCSYFTPSAAPSLPWGRLGVVVPSLRRVVVPTLRYNWDYLMAGAYWLKLSILDLTQVGFGTKVARASAQKIFGSRSDQLRQLIHPSDEITWRGSGASW